MALYLVTTNDGTFVVRSRNGHIARSLIEGADADAEVIRLTDDGPHGIISAVVVPVVAADEQPPAEPDDDEGEKEITSISDKERRFQNMKTGEIRTETF